MNSEEQKIEIEQESTEDLYYCWSGHKCNMTRQP